MGQAISVLMPTPPKLLDHVRYSGTWYEFARAVPEGKPQTTSSSTYNYIWNPDKKSYSVQTDLGEPISMLLTTNPFHLTILSSNIDDQFIYYVDYDALAIVHNYNCSMVQVLIRKKQISQKQINDIKILCSRLIGGPLILSIREGFNFSDNDGGLGTNTVAMSIRI